MRLQQLLDITRRSYITEHSSQCVWASRFPQQRPIWCLRGKAATCRLQIAAHSSGNSAAKCNDEYQPPQGKELAGSEAEWSGEPKDEACNEVELQGLPGEIPFPAANELSKDTEGHSQTTDSVDESCDSQRKLACIVAGAQSLTQTTDQEEVNRYHLFDVLEASHLDTQAGSHFFSQLAMHDSWASPLATDDLLHAARIADITGFALPPIIAAQLQQLVHVSGPMAASATVEPLLAAFGQDLPMLLDFLYGLEVKPSLVWTDCALRAWLAKGEGNGARTANTVSKVRAVMIALETIYAADIDLWIEPAATSHPAVPLCTSPHDIGDGVGTEVPHGWARSSAFGVAASTETKTSVSFGVDVATHQSCEAGYLQSWLDACIAELLADEGDEGALNLPHHRDDLYAMLPYLATAPSAAMVERLHGAAPPSYSSNAYGGTAGLYGGHSTAASSPENVAALLWLCAKSGAKLPPALLQRELRALEAAVLQLQVPLGPNSSLYGDPKGAGSGSRQPGANDPSRTKRHNAAAASANDGSSAAAKATLAAAFALPSAPGSTAASPSPPSTTPLTSRPTSSILPFSLSLPPLPPLPPSFNPRPSSSSTQPSTPSIRLTAHGAYLCFWALHHYRHLYSPLVASSLPLATTLLTATLQLSPSARVLNPRQRCRVLRSLLLCFEADLSRILASYDISRLLSGLDTLGTKDLLPLLQDIAMTTRLNRNRYGYGQHELHFAAANNTGATGWLLVDLQLRYLAVHILQMPGWPERLAGASITAVTASLSSVLEVLSAGGGGSVGGSSGAEAGSADGVVPLGGGASGGSSDSTLSPQRVLSDWLECVMPVIENGVKSVTGDWGESARSPAGGRPNAQSSPQLLPRHQPTGHDLHNIQGSTAVSSVSQYAQPVRNPGSLAVTAAAPPTVTPGEWPSVPRHHQSQTQTQLTSALTPSSSLSSSSPSSASLTAEELIRVLTTLHDTAATLDARTQPMLQRTLMWALQRLGSRAGRWLPHPAAFSRVPEMLIRLDALGWVDVPLEWAEAVVQHPDPESSWFRQLPWPEALRTVLESGHLVQLARAQVLRKHGAAVLTPPTPSLTTPESTEMAARLNLNDKNIMTSTSPSSEYSLICVSAAAVTAADTNSGGTSSSSTAEAFLESAVRLRFYLLSLLATRASTGGATEVRQLALTWQVYGMPYDREALEVVLGVMGRVKHGGGGEDGLLGSGEMRMLNDAMMRLRHVCETAEVPEAEVERLLSPLLDSGL